MPSYNSYQKRFHNLSTNGIAHKQLSDMVMEATWNNDIATQVAYFYDYFHDDEPTKLRDIHPENNPNAVPISIKYIINSTQQYEKDTITVHIQFKPSFDYREISGLNYFDENYGDVYDSIFPIGMYVAIKDNRGKYNKWLVVDLANYYDTQFSTFEILPCNYVFNYVYENGLYSIAGLLRTQSSYTSGVWRDNIIQTTDDVQKFIVPLNTYTQYLYYDQRIIIDAKMSVNSQPRTWKISKVDRINPNGIVLVTSKQTELNKTTDFYDKERKIWWADYNVNPIEKTNILEVLDNKTSNVHSEITFAGIRQEVKIGGNNKKFTVKFYDASNEEIDYQSGEWSVSSEYEYTDSSGIIHKFEDYAIVTNSNDNSKLNQNQIYVKVNKDDIVNMWIGKVCRITHTTTNGISSYVDMSILGL